MAEDFQLQLRGLRYAVRAWGPKSGWPLLAIHGWLDNAASFEVLAKNLPQCRIVAPDLAGHGLSEHRPAQGSYNIWDDLPDLLLLADALAWQKFSLLGHSRGAAIATLLAATAPQRVAALLLLEGFLPLSKQAEQAPAQLTQFVQDVLAAPGRRAPSHPHREDAAVRRAERAKMSVAAAALLAARGVREEGEQVRWRSDPRVTGASAFKLDAARNNAFLDALQAPTLVLLAEQGLSQVSELHAMCERCPEAEAAVLPGGHHFHMEEQAPAVAQHLVQFLQKHAAGEPSK